MTRSTEHKHDSPRTPRATYQDVLDAPAHRVAEIVDGTLYTHPRPAPLQWRARGWVSTSEDRSTGAAAVRAGGGSSTSRLDLHEKRPVYAREGVGHLWLVDPEDRTLEAFELREGQWVLIASAKDDDPVSIRPFDAIAFSLGDLWP